MDYFLGLVVNGIIVGSIYSLVALGLVTAPGYPTAGND